MDPGSSLTFSAEVAREIRQHSQEAIIIAHESQQALADVSAGGQVSEGSAHSMPIFFDASEMASEMSQQQQQVEEELTSEARHRRRAALNMVMLGDWSCVVTLTRDARMQDEILMHAKSMKRAEVRGKLEMTREMLQQVRQAVLTEDEQKRMPLEVAANLFHTMSYWLRLHLSGEETDDAQEAATEAARRMSMPDAPHCNPHTSSGLYFAPTCDPASPEYVSFACKALDCEAAYERARFELCCAMRKYGTDILPTLHEDDYWYQFGRD